MVTTAPREGSMDEVVGLEGVTKRYRRRGPYVLHGLDLALAPSEHAVILGGNGSGKSTLLRILVGLTRPTAGLVRGRPASVGYVPERVPATVRLTAAEYLRHLGAIRGLRPAEARARATELLDRLSLEPGPDTPVNRLSKGNRQKAVLAQAFLVPVELLVLDEPHSGLDTRASAAVDALVDHARSLGTRVVTTGHDATAARAGTTPYRLENGRLRRVAPTIEGRRAPCDPLVSICLLAPPARHDHSWLPVAPDSDPRQPDRVRVVIERHRVDALLSDALGRAYSVLDVRALDAP